MFCFYINNTVIFCFMIQVSILEYRSQFDRTSRFSILEAISATDERNQLRRDEFTGLRATGARG